MEEGAVSWEAYYGREKGAGTNRERESVYVEQVPDETRVYYVRNQYK